MKEFLADWYLWIKAFHLISVIAWMAGLFYLPRLFVYHSNSEVGSAQSDTFIVMEGKLLRIIMNPAMILTYIFGFSLLFTPGVVDWANKSMHIKLTLVALLTGYHHMLVKYFKAFRDNKRPMSEKFFRIINEVPTLLMIGIVIMVIVRPF